MKTEFTIGKALRPRGLKGEIRFELYTSDSSRFKALKSAKLDNTTFNIEKITIEGDFAYIKFEGIDSAEVAETYRGKSLIAMRKDLPKLDGDTIYIADIIGLDIVVDGEVIGELVDVTQFGTVDVYEVKLTNGGRMQFPALKELIKSTDIENGVMVLDGYLFHRVAVFD